MATSAEGQERQAVRLAEAHGFGAAVHACGHPAVGVQAWVAHVVRLAGGFVGRADACGGPGEERIAFVPADACPRDQEPVAPCRQLLAALPDASERERVRSWSHALMDLCAGKRPLEASWGNGSACLDLARGFHRAGPAVQEGHVFRASPESPPEPALPGDTPGPFGLRVRSMRDGGGNGFLVSVAGGRGALLVLGGIPEGAEEILVSVSGGTALLTAAGRPSGQGPLPAFLKRLLRVTPSLLAAVPRKDGGLRVLPARLSGP